MPCDFEQQSAPEVCMVWPDNWLAVQLFARMRRQWNVGPGGPIGLRYEALPVPMRALGIADDDLDTFDALGVMEDEAVMWFSEQRGASRG